jgi:hypothetical protein
VIELKITVPDHVISEGVEGSTSRYLDTCMAALGFSRTVGGQLQPLVHGQAAPTSAAKLAAKIAEADTVNAARAAAGHAPVESSAEVAAAETDEPAEAAGDAGEAAVKRERGKAAPGRARRTKAEIAEDEAADAADAAANGNISTNPENRIDPNDDTAAENTVFDGAKLDDEQTNAQDEADEKAEMAKANEKLAASEKTASVAMIEQIRNAIGEVGDKHGIPVAARVPAWLGKALADFPEAELPNVLKRVQTLIKLDTDTVISFVGDAGEAPSAPAQVETPKEPETVKLVKPSADSVPTATRQQFLEALYRYADFADGTRDQAKMVHTMNDVPEILKEHFGVSRQTDVKEPDLGVAVALVDQAIKLDPFKRKR